MRDLIGAVAVLHEAGVVAAVLPVQVSDLQRAVGLEGHPRRGAETYDLAPLLPRDRWLGFADPLAR